MTLTLSKPSRKLTLVSVRHVYRCREHPDWRIERSHITVGESSSDAYKDVWQVWYWPDCKAWNPNFREWRRSWEVVSEHRTKAAAIKAMTKAIRRGR